MTLIAEHPAPIAADVPAPRLRHWTQRALDLWNRIQARASLSRLSGRDLRDIGLIRSDLDLLRFPGPAADAQTRLALRAGQRAGNW